MAGKLLRALKGAARKIGDKLNPDAKPARDSARGLTGLQLRAKKFGEQDRLIGKTIDSAEDIMKSAPGLEERLRKENPGFGRSVDSGRAFSERLKTRGTTDEAAKRATTIRKSK